MSQETQALLHNALAIGEIIISTISRFRHSKVICNKLSQKVNSSHKFLTELEAQYESNYSYFEQPNYRAAFKNYVTVMKNCLNYLETIEHKALFFRLINADKYKKTFIRLFIDIDQAVSVLKLGLSVKNQATHSSAGGANSNNDHDALKQSQEQMALIASRLGSLHDDVSAFGGQRETILEEIRSVQEDKHGTEDILASVEISRRQLKIIPNLNPRKGRRYHVYKRNYNNQEVAEKIFIEHITSTKMLQDIRKQVVILKKLSVCCYIIQFVGVTSRGSRLGLVTEYAEHGNLKDLLESAQPLDCSLLFNISLSVLHGVSFLHNMQVLHKNIKTSSILIAKDWKAKISGFDFSREMSTATTVILDNGSDRYRWIPPEKLKSDFGYTTKCDVYSLGMVLWSIWSRRYPYEIMSQQSIEQFVSNGGRENIDLTPIEIRPFILSCWHQNPMDRPEANELNDEFEDLSSIYSNNSDGNISDSSAIPSPQTPEGGSLSGRLSDTVSSSPKTNNPYLPGSSNHSPVTKLKMNNYNFKHPTIPDYSSSDQEANHLAQKLSKVHINTPRKLNSFDSSIINCSPTSARTRSLSSSSNNIEIEALCSQGPQLGAKMGDMPVPSAPAEDSSPPPEANGMEDDSHGIMNTHVIAHDQRTFNQDLVAPQESGYETRIFGHDMESLDDDDDLFGEEQEAEPEITLTQAIENHAKGDRKQAYENFKVLSQKGEIKANYYLGYYYFWGQEGVVSKNYERAFYYLNKAAQHQDSDALDHLGMYYASEDNPDKNLVKAFEYYKLSAELGNKKGMYHLGVCYAKGRGTRINRDLALKSISDAADRGHALAIEQMKKAKSRVR